MVNPPYRIQAPKFRSFLSLHSRVFHALLALFASTASWADVDEEILIELPEPGGRSAQSRRHRAQSRKTPEPQAEEPPIEEARSTNLRRIRPTRRAHRGQLPQRPWRVEAIGRTTNLVIRSKEISGQQEYETLIFRTADGKARIERVGFQKGAPASFIG